MTWRPIPEPSYERDIQRLIYIYKRAFTKIANELKVLAGGIERTQGESLLRQIEFLLRELDLDTQKWSEETVTRVFQDGQAYTVLSLGVARNLSEAVAGVSFSTLAKDSVEALVNDTYSDLLLATKNTEKSIKQLVRNVVSDTLRVRAVEQLGRRANRNEIVDKLSRGGMSRTLNEKAWTGIVDRAGRRWNLSTYSEMVVRTKLTQAHIEGCRVETLERGVDLAVVSSHGATDACRNFEGMVISLHGLTKGYRTYSEIRASGYIFHPNCEHHVSPIRDIELLPESLKEKHREAIKNSSRLSERS